MTCPIVFVPSQLLTAQIWQPLVDSPGALGGVFHADHTIDDTIEGMALRLLANAPSKFCLVAQGMGGFVAFEVMRREPWRVKGLAMIGTLASPDTPAQSERRRKYAELVKQGNFAQVIEERLPLLLHPRHAQDLTLLAVLRDMAKATGPDAFLRQQAAIIARQDSRATMRGIVCPVLLVRGSHDGITSEAHFAEMRANMPLATAVTIPDCGHVPTLERPDLIAPLFTKWMASH